MNADRNRLLSGKVDCQSSEFEPAYFDIGSQCAERPGCILVAAALGSMCDGEVNPATAQAQCESLKRQAISAARN